MTITFGPSLALNSAVDSAELRMLVPAGRIVGNDGRIFINDEPERVVTAFRTNRLSVPVDINHAQFLKSQNGEESPAVGWIEDLKVEGGGIYGRIEWTPRGREALAAKEYRYLSPALRIDAVGKVLAVIGAGLVNRPNFNMPALNAARSDAAAPGSFRREGSLMSFTPRANAG
jgi:phage I-like protein